MTYRRHKVLNLETFRLSSRMTERENSQQLVCHRLNVLLRHSRRHIDAYGGIEEFTAMVRLRVLGSASMQKLMQKEQPHRRGVTRPAPKSQVAAVGAVPTRIPCSSLQHAYKWPRSTQSRWAQFYESHSWAVWLMFSVTTTLSEELHQGGEGQTCRQSSRQIRLKDCVRLKTMSG